MGALQDIFKAVQKETPKSLGPHAWYLATAAALVALGKPNEIGTLSTYLNSKVAPDDNSSKDRISRQLRDVLMKEWTLVGIPLVITAVAFLAKAEKGQELDEGLSEKWQNSPSPHALSERGTAYLQTLYAQDLAPIFSTWGSHQADFEFLEKNIIYGFYLSDHEVLPAVETEVVCLTAIMCQGLRAPTIWHLRGLRRLGINAVDVEALEKVIEMIAEWAGKNTSDWPRITDVELS